MPSSCAVRNTRMAISERLATSSLRIAVEGPEANEPAGFGAGRGLSYDATSTSAVCASRLPNRPTAPRKLVDTGEPSGEASILVHFLQLIPEPTSPMYSAADFPRASG